MVTFSKEGTPKTPEINFIAEQGLLEIKGKSIPENSIEFYKPLLDWIDEYAKSPNKTTELKVQLEYFNTSSSKCLLDVFRRLEAIQKNGTSQVEVKWMYEEQDEDMMEAGDDYQTIVGIPFSLIKA